MPARLATLAIVLVAIVGAYVRWTPPARVADLYPHPDALEYESAASSVLRGDGYVLTLPEGRFPPRYPAGFSLLLVPALWVLGDSPGNGIAVVLTAALATIVATAAIAWRSAGPVAGVAAAGLLALTPLHVQLSRVVMADVPAAAIVTGLAWAGLRMLDGTRRLWQWMALGALAGLAAGVRPLVPLVVAPVGTLLAMRRPVHAAALALASAVGAMPWLIADVVRFRRPFGGYAFWVRDVPFVGWSFAVERPLGGGTEANVVAYAHSLIGGGDLYPWPAAVLIAVGAVTALARGGPARRLAVVALGTAAGFAAAHVPFFWQDERFLLPAVPLLLALGTTSLAATSIPIYLGAMALTLLALVVPLRTPAAFETLNATPWEAPALKAFAMRTDADAVLLASADALLVERIVLRDGRRLWIPIGDDGHATAIRKYGLMHDDVGDGGAIATAEDLGRVEGRIASLLAAGRPVYWLPDLGSDGSGMRQMVDRLLRSRFVLRPVPGTFNVPGVVTWYSVSPRR